MRTIDFDYHLPEELIADRPAPHREDSRMLVVHRSTGLIEHRKFTDLLEYVRPGDEFVMNNTKVVPARYFSNDGRIELVRASLHTDLLWKCLVRPGRKMKIDRKTPSMNREDPDDKGTRRLAIAAPTAGLHFTPEILEQMKSMSASAPSARSDRIMHTESFVLPEETARRIAAAHRVVAVGTTSVRVLEHLAARNGLPLSPAAGETDIFIYPPYEYKIVDALLTNFHLPQSTLLTAKEQRPLLLLRRLHDDKERYNTQTRDQTVAIREPGHIGQRHEPPRQPSQHNAPTAGLHFTVA